MSGPRLYGLALTEGGETHAGHHSGARLATLCLGRLGPGPRVFVGNYGDEVTCAKCAELMDLAEDEEREEENRAEVQEAEAAKYAENTERGACRVCTTEADLWEGVCAPCFESITKRGQASNGC